MTLHTGDCLEVMAGMPDASVDAVVTDPPYGLEFMGKGWDKFGAEVVDAAAQGGFQDGSGGNPFSRSRVRYAAGHSFQAWCEAWGREALRVTVPGGYLLAFGGTRTHHRLVCGLEDAGWIIRDELDWVYASGFPKGKANLKPAHEPIVLARKPGPLRMLGIDVCRIPLAGEGDREFMASRIEAWSKQDGWDGPAAINVGPRIGELGDKGRWPSNVILTDDVFQEGTSEVVGGTLSDTMYGSWNPSLSPVNEPSHASTTAENAGGKSTTTEPGLSSEHSATGLVGMQLGAWETSTDTPKPDTGCSPGTMEDGDATSGSTAASGKMRTARSRRGTLSTTGTVTDSTTDSTTSKSSAEPSTSSNIRPYPPASARAAATREPGTSDDSNDASANWNPNSLPVEQASYSRFFLIPKADRGDREPVLRGQLEPGMVGGRSRADGRQWDIPGSTLANGKPKRENTHATVKPIELMRHLVRLVTPPGGTVLDPFLGSGTTAIACEMEGFAWIGIEKEPEYVAIAEARLNGVQKGLGLV